MESKEICRCKLYMLTKDNEWIDQSTGIPSIEKSPRGTNYELKFKSEENQLEVYDMEITKESLFEHKEDNIIAWFHPLKNVYMALSFQNEKGAHDLWEKIQEISFDHEGNNFDFLNEESFLEPDFYYSFKDEEINIPEPNFTNLTQIAKNISEVIDFEKKLHISNFFVHHTKYIENLKNIFIEAETKNDIESISQILLVIKSLISFSDRTLLHILMSDEYYLFVFGVLEYDPEVYKRMEITHREYFQKIVKFHEVAKIKNDQILNIIHINYRLTYLKDNALGFFLDERSMALITLMTYNIYGEIIKFVKNNNDFVISLLENVKNNDIMALKLICEILSVSKILEIDKINLIETFEAGNFFSIIEENLLTNYNNESSEIETKDQLNYLFEIILLILQMKPIMLKKYVVSNEQKSKNFPFLNFLFLQIFKKKDDDFASFSAETLNFMLEIDLVNNNNINNTNNNNNNNNEYVILNPHPQDICIDNILEKILSFLLNEEQINKNNFSLKLIYSLLITMTKNISEKMKNFWRSYPYFAKLFAIFKFTKDKDLILSSLKLFKSFLMIQDKEISILLQKSITDILDLFLSLSFNSKNLIFSIILEIFKIIYQERIQILMDESEILLKNVVSMQKQQYLLKCIESFKLLIPTKKIEKNIYEYKQIALENSQNLNENRENEENDLKKKNQQISIKAKNNQNNSIIHSCSIIKTNLKHKKLVNYEEEEEENDIELKERNDIYKKINKILLKPSSK